MACCIPIIFLGNIFNNLHQYTASQDVVQRYQASDSMDETKKSLWTNGVLALISTYFLWNGNYDVFFLST